MMANIKSIFFIKYLFSYIKDKNKLKLVRYNKNLQNNLSINIINYKLLSERYIIYETKEKGKEYDRYNDRLIYEGEYLNGKRNGKGKEYDQNYYDILRYEGEYLNGIKNGKGKMFYNNGTTSFEGEFKDGKIWNGKGYNLKNEIIYEIKEGKGYVKEYINYYDKLLLIEGEYVNGERNGKGKKFHYNGNLEFEGEYKNGKIWTGKVYNRRYGGIYEIKEGKGFIKEFDECAYIIFEGEYVNGERNGKGIEYDEYGDISYEGEYLNGKRNGYGKEFVGDKLVYEGEYLKGKSNGYGKEYNNKRHLIFEGEYLNGYKRKGKSYINQRIEFEGEYLFGIKWNGKGYDETGKIIYELNNGNGKIKEYSYEGNLLDEGEY